jgi:hypothetical protein
VYSSDNDAVDHQVVSMEFADGATGSFAAARQPFELKPGSWRVDGVTGPSTLQDLLT